MFYHNYSYSVQRTKKNTKDMEEYGYNKKVWYIILDVQFPKKILFFQKNIETFNYAIWFLNMLLGFFYFFVCWDYNGEVLTFHFTKSLLDELSLLLLHTIKELYAFWTFRFIKVLDCVNTTLNELSSLLFTLYLSNVS